jgi:cation diffusion facilitator family transporter
MKSNEVNSRISKKAIYFSLISHIILAIIKGLSGILGNSFALIADAIESTTDIFASCLVLLGIRYAHKPPDQNHPYGHGKIEPLVTFVVVVFLVVSAVIIAIESISNINTPHESPAPWTLFVLGIIITWKEVSYRMVLKKSKETQSTALKAEAWHHRSDAITSVMAFIGISASVLLGEGYEDLDDWAALIASIIILYNSYIIFRPALGEIMDEHLYDEMVEQVEVTSREVTGVIGIEKCFIRKAGMDFHIDLHLIVDGEISVKDGHEIAHNLKDHLRANISGVSDVLIHVEPDSEERLRRIKKAGSE